MLLMVIDSLEIGGLDGTPDTRSMTYDLEAFLGWRRILVEGNPADRNNLFAKSPLAFSASAAVCKNRSKLHYANEKYTGGIIEFMDLDFLASWHADVFSSGDPFETGDFNISLVHWEEFDETMISIIDCIPMHEILKTAGIKHINFFILDVEVL